MPTYVRAIYRLDAGVDGPRKARRIVEQELREELPKPALEDVKLLVSELVTNGIRHGSRGGADMITLELVINGKVRCTVSDRGPGFSRGRGPDPEGGWGLKLVEQVAARWGLVHSENGTQVWFEPATTPQSSPEKSSPSAG
jgi:anti-sigma regulatory factor (Ser/Thr protein kinase)